MTRKAFIKCCLRERQSRSVNPAITIKYVCDDCATGQQVEGLAKQRKQRERLLRDGDFPADQFHLDEMNIDAPEGIEFLELDQLKEQRAMTIEKESIPKWNWLPITVQQAENITPHTLLSFWKSTPLKVGTRGTCPNCLRPDMACASYGICGGCRVVVRGMKGIALLQALADQGKKLHDQYVLQQSCSGDKNDEPQEENMAEKVEKVESWQPAEIGGLTEVQQLIVAETDSLRDMLIAKNKAYGNSAIDPVRIFSKASTIEQINVRLDDKLSRMMRGENAGEDVELDMLGYMILRRVFRKIDAAQAA